MHDRRRRVSARRSWRWRSRRRWRWRPRRRASFRGPIAVDEPALGFSLNFVASNNSKHNATQHAVPANDEHPDSGVREHRVETVALCGQIGHDRAPAPAFPADDTKLHERQASRRERQTEKRPTNDKHSRVHPFLVARTKVWLAAPSLV